VCGCQSGYLWKAVESIVEWGVSVTEMGDRERTLEMLERG
jgi:biotin operon repressor